MSKVTLRHIYKVYEGGVRAVNDFDLEIKDKEFIVFVGPSGCGKSTTLRMIAGLENITSGQLYIDDALVNDVDSKDRDIAMVFQNYALYPHMTVFQNMAFGLKLRKEDPKEIEKRVNEAAEILEIKDLLSRKPKALSGGQRQRVALGRAIVREPKVFLLDEPLSNLDAKLRVQMRTEITKLHKKLETTFIYVTHDQTEAMTMGDRIVVMKLGYVQQVDTPVNLYENPANLFVATFLGSPQMNIIPCDLVEKNGDLTALLNGNSTMSVVFPKQKAEELQDRIFIGKKMLLGIRPEHIRFAQEGFPGTIDVIEQLGDMTIAYVSIEGQKDDLIVKGRANGSLKAKQKVHLEFLMDESHLFDPETTASVLGVPQENHLLCTLEGEELHLGKQTILLSKEYQSHLLQGAHEGKKMTLSISPKSLTLKHPLNGVKITGKVAFIERKTDSASVYLSLEDVASYLIFLEAPDTPLNEGDAVTLYCAEEALILKDEEGNRLNAREKVYPNTLKANIRVLPTGRCEVSFGQQTLVVPSLGVKSGVHEIEIDQEKVQVLYSKKMAKLLKKTNPPFKKEEILPVSSYDEDPLGKKNAIYVALPGGRNYSTFVIPNDFSVYKMPKFDLLLLPGALRVIS